MELQKKKKGNLHIDAEPRWAREEKEVERVQFRVRDGNH